MTTIFAGAEDRVNGLEKGKIIYCALKNPGKTCCILYSL